jgi:hypothetical protein
MKILACAMLGFHLGLGIATNIITDWVVCHQIQYLMKTVVDENTASEKADQNPPSPNSVPVVWLSSMFLRKKSIITPPE